MSAPGKTFLVCSFRYVLKDFTGSALALTAGNLSYEGRLRVGHGSFSVLSVEPICVTV